MQRQAGGGFMSSNIIGVLASGRGSNFASISKHIKEGKLDALVGILITNKPDAGALDVAKEYDIPTKVIIPKEFENKEAYENEIVETLNEYNVKLVALAGYMKIVGKPLLTGFKNRIMNIHPALLPSFPGLHGVKQAVDYGAKVSGCTVHFIDDGVDTGPVIIQKSVEVEEGDTEETLAARILTHEHQIYPKAIDLFFKGRLKLEGRKVIIK